MTSQRLDLPNLRASRFTVRQVAGRAERFGLTLTDAVRDVKAANARGGRRGARSRRRKPRIAASALAVVLLLAVAPIAWAQATITFDTDTTMAIAKCHATLRDALTRAQEYVRDPDEVFFTMTDSLYRPPCRICELRAEIERVERRKAAARAIREALEQCP